MTTTFKEAIDASTAITCTLTSLATASARGSNSVDNSTNLYPDALVTVTVTIASGTPTSTGSFVNVYVFGSEDGTNFGTINSATAGTPGTDGAFGALTVTPNLIGPIAQIAAVTITSTGERTFRSQPIPIAQAFGGSLPRKWGILIENQTGLAFSTSTTTTAQYVSYSGVYGTGA